MTRERACLLGRGGRSALAAVMLAAAALAATDTAAQASGVPPSPSAAQTPTAPPLPAAPPSPATPPSSAAPPSPATPPSSAAAPAPVTAAEPGCASLGGAARERFDTERYAVAFRTVPPTIAIGQPFAIESVFCPHGGGPMPSSLRLDAQMPEHRHGMNYRPTVSPQGRGRFLAQGMVFHMPGRWQLVFDVTAGSRTERIARDVVVD